MKDTIVLVVDIICITVLGIVVGFNKPANPDIFYAIFGILSAIAGASGRTVIPPIARKAVAFWRFKK